MVSADMGRVCCWHATKSTEQVNAMIARGYAIIQKCNSRLIDMRSKEK
jgi:hypothetical protein